MCICMYTCTGRQISLHISASSSAVHDSYRGLSSLLPPILSILLLEPAVRRTSAEVGLDDRRLTYKRLGRPWGVEWSELDFIGSYTHTSESRFGQG